MSIKISVNEAASRYRVTQRTVFRWIERYEIHRFEDGLYDRDQLDALNENYANPSYAEIDWSKAACKNLPTEFFYKIEERGIVKLIDVDVIRFTCAPCPIWARCLRYAASNENYGVWGGCTTDERRSLLDYRNSEVKNKVIKDFAHYGITEEMINDAIGK